MMAAEFPVPRSGSSDWPLPAEPDDVVVQVPSQLEETKDDLTRRLESEVRLLTEMLLKHGLDPNIVTPQAKPKEELAKPRPRQVASLGFPLCREYCASPEAFVERRLLAFTLT